MNGGGGGGEKGGGGVREGDNSGEEERRSVEIHTHRGHSLCEKIYYGLHLILSFRLLKSRVF